MIEHHSSIIIARPPDVVFGYIIDPENLGKYRLDLSSYEIRTPGAFGKGTRWLEHGVPLGSKPIISEVEVIDFVPGKQFTICTTTENIPFYTVYAVEPIVEGAQLTFHLKGELPGLLKMVEPLIRRRVVSATEANFDNLKRVLETMNK